jgi:hypothetical protein
MHLNSYPIRVSFAGAQPSFAWIFTPGYAQNGGEGGVRGNRGPFPLEMDVFSARCEHALTFEFES